MKKKWIAMTMCMALTASALTGCGKDKTDDTKTESSAESEDDVLASGDGTGGTGNGATVDENGDITSFAYVDGDKAPDGTSVVSGKDYKIEDCVKLPDLHSMTVPCSTTGISDDEAEGYVRSSLDAKALDKDAKAKRWDRLTIDYTTSYKGTTLDQKRSGSLVIIGSYSLPEKVENALVGHKTGDEVKVDVEFPSTYEGNPSFVGKKITYNIKVIGVARTKDPSADEIAKAKSKLQQNVDSSLLFSKYEATAKYIEDNATFTAYPKKYLEEARINYELKYIGTFGSVSKYAEENGMTTKTVKKQEDDWIIPVVRRRVITEAVAKELGVSKDSQAYKDKQAEAKYSDDEGENLLYTALDKIINEIKYTAN